MATQRCGRTSASTDASLHAAGPGTDGEDACLLFVPVRCPSSATFDLASLLQTSTKLENDLLDLELEQQEPANTSSQPLDPPHPSPSSCSPLSYAPGPVNSLPHNRSERPPGMDYQHWLRSLKMDVEYESRGHKPRKKTLKALVPVAAKTAEKMGLSCLELPATNGAYAARICKEEVERRPYSLEEVKEMGIRVLEWDGLIPVPLLDKDGRIFAVLAGRPTDERYSKACEAVYTMLQNEARDTTFAPDELSHRRGEYPALNVGVTHGMGTLRPTWLDNGVHTTTVNRILADENLQRIASYSSAAFSLWAPRTYKYYKTRLDAMYMHTKLRRLFRRSVFPAAALNFGPKVCTCKHNDSKNCPFGWCSVTPLGRFNHKTGGHLILWELGVAVEFPAGSTILFPSATISHSNTAIGDEEERASFTQYCAGGLFRWVDYGFRTEKELKKSDHILHEQMMRRRPEQWRIGVELWSTVHDLMGDMEGQGVAQGGEVQTAV